MMQEKWIYIKKEQMFTIKIIYDKMAISISIMILELYVWLKIART